MTKTRAADATLNQKVRQYAVTGRLQPTEANPEPEVFRMTIFARNEVVAKSRFWYFMKRLQRAKKANGEVLDVAVVQERRCNKVKNFGMWIRYDTRTGTTNMYKEYRDICREGAISQMYSELAGRHRARSASIQVIKVQALHPQQCRRTHMIQMQKNVKFPHVGRIPMANKDVTSTFVASRAKTFFQ